MTKPDLFGRFEEAMALIAEISRSLTSTRGGVRRIDAKARQRLSDRTVTESAEHSRRL
ncbi:hypothetical protein ABZ078_37935 [Streptomyces sp. NPDC006385]|uniref:hypothetical protein n=1 Tax=Streptomyces sp. NPDC006385 TaxID=3156761 RepID=UPI0033B93CA0